MSSDNRTPLDRFIERIGEDVIASRVGVGVPAVRMARGRKQLPSSWFNELEALAKSKRVKIDRDWFNWSRPRPAPAEGEAA